MEVLSQEEEADGLLVDVRSKTPFEQPVSMWSGVKKYMSVSINLHDMLILSYRLACFISWLTEVLFSWLLFSLNCFYQ